ncbi:ribosomal subunit interface protein [Bacillus cereus]|uniref:Ribosomal subunit interface protein n=3 Tax=Bacillaceae TaxID=186817 RepID=A0A9X6ZH83_BACCE|nr:ribosomal subunit interface protein [Bacillus cereus]PGB10003.1 ribosomal subunit interface protein [Bacillus toyonensis]HDR7922700.1 ribosome-associated translation inhibitor RaiA [Bacillus paranthracis]
MLYMNLTMTGKHVSLTEGMKFTMNKKLDFLNKFLKEDTIVSVTVQVEKGLTISVSVPFNGELIYAKSKDEDFYVALDSVVDKVKRQITTAKDLEKSMRRLHKKHILIPIANETEMKEVKLTDNIVKRKQFELKPMHEEEAILQMEVLGHKQFLFVNAELNDTICLLYTRKDGKYGMIESCA